MSKLVNHKRHESFKRRLAKLGKRVDNLAAEVKQAKGNNHEHHRR